MAKAYRENYWTKTIKKAFLKEMNYETKSKEVPQNKNGFSESCKLLAVLHLFWEHLFSAWTVERALPRS